MRQYPIASTLALAGCFADWFLTRPWKILILYFLPMVFALSVVGLVVTGSLLNKDILADHYLQLANAEVKTWEMNWAPLDPANDEEVSGATAELTTKTDAPQIPATAELLFRRVQELQQNDRRSMFFVAMSYIQRGAVQQGMTMLNRIAPLESIGYLPAHAFLADYYLRGALRRQDLPMVRHHALASMRWERAPASLLASISQLLYNINDHDAAVEAMQKAATRDPNYRLPLSKLASVVPKFQPLADESLKSATKHFVRKLERNPQDVNARLMLVDAYCQAQDFQAAEKSLAEALKLSDNPVYKTALSEVYCRVFVSTAKFDGQSWSGDINLLEKAYRLDPNNMHIYEEVAKLARITGTSPHDELMNQLRNKLAEGNATSTMHTWIAEHYLIRQEFDKAIPHLEQSIKRDPLASRCWNNLAYCIADRHPERLEDALSYADQAVKIAPLMPDFHDTRGTVLMKMKRFSDAVAAYERAIETISLSQGRFLPQPAYHERLAQAYRALGDNDMAQVHDKRVVELNQQYAAAKAQVDQGQAALNQADTSDKPSEPVNSQTNSLTNSEASRSEPSTPEPSPTKEPTVEATEEAAQSPAKESTEEPVPTGQTPAPPAPAEAGKA